MKSIRLIMLGMVALTTSITFGKDFGTQGHSYQITEQEFLQMIAERLKKIDMKKEQKKMQSLVRDRVGNPRAVEAVKPATATRSFYFDPTYTLDQDVVLPCGKILHKAGTKVNPLEHMDLNRRLLFIDTRRIEQVKWLMEELDKCVVMCSICHTDTHRGEHPEYLKFKVSIAQLVRANAS